MLEIVMTKLTMRKKPLVVRLFSLFTVGLLLILILQNVAEVALVKALLHVPKPVKQQIINMASEAEPIIQQHDPILLAQWEEKQPFYAFVVDQNNDEMSTRQMHPHFEFKLKYVRNLDALLDSRVNQPIFMLPLKGGNKLMVQLPHYLHPAKYFSFYFGAIQLVIALLITLMFSFILARHLQQPLDTLKKASRSLANGDFSVRVAHAVGDSTKEFYDLATDFDEMADHIQRLTDKQRRLIRDVSHELRTPLARHNLSLHLLRKRTPDAQLHLVDRLAQEADEMNGLVEEILAFSQFEYAKATLTLTPLDIQGFCHSSIEHWQSLLKPTQTLRLACEHPLPLVDANAHLLMRAIKNLLGNAVKYAGNDAQMWIETSIVLKHGVQYAAITVNDDGEGIPASHWSHIFDPFTRIEQARDKQSGGYGLGLSIVKEAVQAMGGEVDMGVSSMKGVKVTLMLPISTPSV